MKILIAEDEPVSRRILSLHLQKWGFSVTEALDGAQACDLLLEQDFDVVITDWMMPQMDGATLAREIRKRDGDGNYTYIIMLSALGAKEDVVKGLSQGQVDDYITKPFDPEELKARLQVGQRIVRLERELRQYSHGLEEKVRGQTIEIRRSQEETIIKLMTALQYRDVETGSHVRRLGLCAAELAVELGWSSAMVDDIRMAAPMHDIGKIGVPDAILCKPGKLTPEEFETIKTHTDIGGSILQGGRGSMLKMACDIALYHHERWDGAGYPKGLAGEDIPPAARMVAIVDVFDAMSHDRVYREAMPEPQVLEVIRSGGCGIFEPRVVEAFFDIMPRIREVLRQNPNTDLE